jgi:hypothetical protein
MCSQNESECAVEIVYYGCEQSVLATAHRNGGTSVCKRGRLTKMPSEAASFSSVNILGGAPWGR